MNRVLLILIWILTATLMASAQTTFFYPHIVNGELGNISWKTTILLTNPASSGSATGAMTFTQDNNSLLSSGSTWPIILTDDSGFTTASSTVTFSLPPGGTRKYVSTPGGFVSGFANVTTNSGTVHGTAIFSEFDSAGNLIGEAGVPAVSAVARQTILVDTVGRYGVGVAYANPGGVVANITLTLLDTSGAAVMAPVTQSLGSGNHTQGFTSQFFPAAPALIGTMQITSSQPLIAVALRFDPTLSKFTTLPPVSLTSLIYAGMEWLQERGQSMLQTPVATLVESFRFRMS